MNLRLEVRAHALLGRERLFHGRGNGIQFRSPRNDDGLVNRRGMAPDEARYAAERRLGNRLQIREEIYLMNTIGWLDTLWQDLRFGVRLLRRTPGFTAVAVLSSENKRQFYIPPGFAHGFCVTSETALFAYKCTEFYDPKAEASLLWNDPALGIEWPLLTGKPLLLSQKDQAGTPLAEADCYA